MNSFHKVACTKINSRKILFFTKAIW